MLLIDPSYRDRSISLIMDPQCHAISRYVPGSFVMDGLLQLRGTLFSCQVINRQLVTQETDQMLNFSAGGEMSKR